MFGFVLLLVVSKNETSPLLIAIKLTIIECSLTEKLYLMDETINSRKKLRFPAFQISNFNKKPSRRKVFS